MSNRIGLPQDSQSSFFVTVTKNTLFGSLDTEAGLQRYMSLLVEKVSVLGEHYVARQLDWADRRLMALGAAL